ncbi:MAG: leucine-rich repeat protein [Bacteroidales bacterium]|nr:leucine-rich repeat protein [Bacteroidales bacterium]
MNRVIPKMVFLLAILMRALGMKAHPVDMNIAREIGFSYMNTNGKAQMRSVNDLQLAATYSIDSGEAAFYIFNTPTGFVIVSGDNCVTPILGYSEERQFDVENIPIQLQDYLQGFVKQIEHVIKNHLGADEQTTQQWEMVRATGRLIDIRSDRAVEPLITDLWDQGCYYNALCPEDEIGDCGHVYAGCVATAMAQIMRYWGYPEQGTGSHSYSPPGYPEQYVDFGATTYDWDNMPIQLDGTSNDEQLGAVATLLWHCGVSVDMEYSNYSSEASLSSPKYAMKDYFMYSDESDFRQQDDYSDAIWKARLKDCLDLGRPVFYAGFSDLFGGHAFVCDGYDEDEFFHFNWGWSGEGNGYYAIGALNVHLVYSYFEYNGNNCAIFNIHPQGETTNYTINVSVNNDNGGTVSGGGTYAHGDIVSLVAIAQEGYEFSYWEENGGIASTNSNYSFTARYNRDLVAHFDLLEENIVFADANVKAICVANWDTNGDGELSYDEAAAVSSLGQVFRGNTEITSFEELQYFIGLSSISNYAFRDCSGLSGLLKLPNSVTSIGYYAFSGCSGFTGDLTIPNSVTTIGESAFEGCSGFTGSLTIGNSVTSIGDFAFWGCSGFTGDLTIPNSVTEIGRMAFYSCSGFSGNLTIPDSITSMGFGVFYNCSSLTGNLIIPSTWTKIEGYTFYNCRGLSGDLIIPNSVTEIDEFAFFKCTGFTGNLTIPNSVTSIGTAAFYLCTGFKGNLTIPNSVNNIGNNAFSSCNGLTGDLIIPSSLTKIGKSVFYGCHSFSGDLIIPQSVTSIGESAFFNCIGLTSIILYSETPPTMNSNSFNNVPKTIPVWVPCGSAEAYQSDQNWSQFTNTQESCMQQTVMLSEGWNWVSLSLEMSPVVALQLLEEALGDHAEQIKARNGQYTEYDDEEEAWFGNLTGLTSENMYMIYVANDCTIALEGTPVSPTYHEITIVPGWNWIGFPCTMEMSVAEAFAAFEAEEDDELKGRGPYTTFDGEAWFGGLTTLQPGQGYMYYSNSSVTKTLIFPSGAK